MPRTRRDVWKLGQQWHPTILWYARAVKVLSERPFDDMTSWLYLAAMHGVTEQLWRHHGYLKPNQKLPTTAAFQQEDRDQCQHHTWYFLPWHRGYLRAFEKIVGAAIAAMPGGPQDWALPYWNYNGGPNTLQLPPAFGSATWPDGGANPLFVEARYGSSGKSGQPIVLDEDAVSVEAALLEPDYVGASTGGSPGFGGGKTPFKHGAQDRNDEGLLEQSPHDNVHGEVGGALNNQLTLLAAGLMSVPSTAALDPIFWLHHANIDRLWQVWLNGTRHANPTTEPSWMDGPAGAKPFIMPEPDNGTRTKFFPREMLDTTAPKLDYIYEDVTNPFAGRPRVAVRMAALGSAVPIAAGGAMAREPHVELLGAQANAVRLAGPEAEARVRLDAAVNQKVVNSFRALSLSAPATQEPDRVFLNLENIKGSSDATSFKVYVGLKPGEKPQEHSDHLAGVVTLFGLGEASATGGPHGGNGLNKVIEITRVIDRLYPRGGEDLNELPVRFVLRRGQGSDVEIGRISVYRQEGGSAAPAGERE